MKRSTWASQPHRRTPPRRLRAVPPVAPPRCRACTIKRGPRPHRTCRRTLLRLHPRHPRRRGRGGSPAAVKMALTASRSTAAAPRRHGRPGPNSRQRAPRASTSWAARRRGKRYWRERSAGSACSPGHRTPRWAPGVATARGPVRPCQAWSVTWWHGRTAAARRRQRSRRRDGSGESRRQRICISDGAHDVPPSTGRGSRSALLRHSEDAAAELDASPGSESGRS